MDFVNWCLARLRSCMGMHAAASAVERMSSPLCLREGTYLRLEEHQCLGTLHPKTAACFRRRGAF